MLLPACTTPPATAPKQESQAGAPLSVAIREHAIAMNTLDLSASDPVFASAQVIGLGEATHGQQEVFAFKRALTMHLIRYHKLRTVAYESSASRARLCDDYINARTDSLDSAMRGMGMMIWRVQENAQLLRDLRAWNLAAAPADRVRFIGVDIQDPAAAADRLGEIMRATPQPLMQEEVTHARMVVNGIDAAVQAFYATGDTKGFDRIASELLATQQAVQAICESGKLTPDLAAEANLRASELRWGIEMFRTGGGRDKAMAQMLIDQLAPGERAVFWAHNEHIKKGPLTYLNSEELAAGGHLAAALGDRYHAMGVIFHAGDFHALAQDAAGAWLFRSYTITPDLAQGINGNIAAPFIDAGLGPSLLPVNIDPAASSLQTWLTTPHPMVWFGGYRIPDDLRTYLAQHPPLTTTPLTDYDSLAYWPTTTSSVLFDLR